MKKMTIVLAILILLPLLVYLMLNYSIKYTKVKIPERMKNIPETAVWDGGADGGNWIDCSNIDSVNNVFHCTVFNDFSGEIVYDGKMKLEGKITSDSELKRLLGIYGGDVIYLKDKRVLHSLIAIDSSKTK